MGSIRAGDGDKAHALVEPRRTIVFRAQAYTGEVSPGLLHEARDQCSTNATISPRRSHEHAADAAHIWPAGEGVTVKAAYRNQQTLIQTAAEGLSRGVKPVHRARPFLHQSLNEVVALNLRLR